MVLYIIMMEIDMKENLRIIEEKEKEVFIILMVIYLQEILLKIELMEQGFIYIKMKKDIKENLRMELEKDLGNISENGDIYEGNFKNEIREGKGIIYKKIKK